MYKITLWSYDLKYATWKVEIKILLKKKICHSFKNKLKRKRDNSFLNWGSITFCFFKITFMFSFIYVLTFTFSCSLFLFTRPATTMAVMASLIYHVSLDPPLWGLCPHKFSIIKIPIIFKCSSAKNPTEIISVIPVC